MELDGLAARDFPSPSGFKPGSEISDRILGNKWEGRSVNRREFLRDYGIGGYSWIAVSME